MTDPVVQHVLSRVRREGEHLFWSTRSGRFRFRGGWYVAKSVLCGKAPGPGYMWWATCGERDCVNPEHLVHRPAGNLATRGPRPGPRHKECLRCGRAMRAHGALSADYPGTVPQGARGLCMTCKKHSSTDKVATHLRMTFMSPYTQALWDKLLPGGDEFVFDHAVVRRNVPEDLWKLFGVDSVSEDEGGVGHGIL